MELSGPDSFIFKIHIYSIIPTDLRSIFIFPESSSKMHLTNLFGICLAVLAGTTAAMPHVAGPYHGHRIAVQVPTNSTGAHNATSTGTRGRAPLSTGIVQSKNGTKHRTSHGLNSVQKEGKGANHCNELCSLEAQTCTIATPDDDKFCWNEYNRCIKNCRPDDFQ